MIGIKRQKRFKSVDLKELLKSLIAMRFLHCSVRMRPPMLINSRVLVLLLVLLLVLVLRITIMCQGVFSSDQTIMSVFVTSRLQNDQRVDVINGWFQPPAAVTLEASIIMSRSV